MIKQLLNNNTGMKVLISFKDEDGFELTDIIPIEMWALYENGDVAPMIFKKEGLVNAQESPNFKGFNII